MQLPKIKLPDRAQIRTYVQDFRRDVIRMMRLKFICMAMMILIAVFLIMLTSINIIMNTVSRSQSQKLLKQIAESERYSSVSGMGGDRDPSGQPPEPPPGETFPEDRQRPPEEETSDASGNSESAENVRFSDAGGFVPLTWDETEETWAYDDDWSWWWSAPPGGGWRDDRRWQETDDDRNPAETDDDFREEQRPPEWNDDDRPQPGEVPPWEMTETQPTDARAPEPHTQAPAEPSATEPPAAPEPTEAVIAPAEEPPTEPPTDPEPQTEAPTEPETPSETQTDTTPPAPPEDEEGTPPPKPGESGFNGSNNSMQPPDQRDQRDRWNMDIVLDHFAILVDENGAFIDLRNTENYTDEEATEIMEGILAKNRTEGMYGWLQFYVTPKDYGTLIVATDKTSDQGLLNNLFRLTIIIGILMLLLLLGILIVASRWITQPMQQAFTRQKQFVSDAGHELKTPIAVLTANADILQDEVGENKWLGYMQEQIGRMNQLVGDLLRLARMDNATQEYNFEDFDLSMAVAATTLPFESAAFEKHRSLEMDVQPEVTYHGSEQHIRQLCAIFIDNAIKYSNENGIIRVTLLKRGDRAVLEFYNTGCEIGPDETEKIFERFYRGDKARNNKGKSGYGLGLAIAKSIMDVHKIRIQVTCEQGKWIRFLLTL